MTSEPTTPAAWGIQLSKLWVASGQGFPIDPGALALEVTRTRFKEEPIALVRPLPVSGIDGMLTRRTRGDWCISYDPSVVVPGRVAFTIAHEFGHYLLHRKLREDFICGQLAMLDYSGEASRRIEKEANQFASYLLMPADDFRNKVVGNNVTLEYIGELAKYYGTSLTATALKWIDITDESAMLVVARDEFICWSYPSALARRQGAYLPPGAPVPSSALERAVSCCCSSANRQISVAPGVWHPTKGVHECSLFADQYDQAIFLIKFESEIAAKADDELSLDADE